MPTKNTHPLHLALIRQRYNPFGGAERFIERALGVLVREGAKISLLTRNWEGATQTGFTQHICNPPYSRFWGGRTARDRSFAACVTKAMQNGHYDIIQSHERIPGCTVFRAGDGVHAAWLNHRARSVGWINTFFSRNSSFHRYILAQEKAMLHHPALQAVICNSWLVYGEMQRYYNVAREKLVVIENGVDLDDFHPRLVAERARQRQMLGLAPDCPVFLFVGSGFERKGVTPLLEALALCKNKTSRAVIVGDDRHFTLYEYRAKKLKLTERVIFAGPQKDVRPFYGMADAFVLPTLYDPMPNAALEAMASGLPIITSDSCGIAARVTAGQNGFVCDALDVPQIAGFLDQLAEPGAALAMRDNARAAVADLDLESMASKLIKLYQGLQR